MLVVDDLAKEINDALSVKDAHGKPISVTPEMKTYANAIITTFHACTTAHAPGTVTGTTAPASPLSNGAASNGLLVAFLPATWLGVMTSGFPKSNSEALSKDANGSTGYISGAAKINYASGKIVGVTTNTPLAPGILTAGAGTDGTVDDLDGTAWAAVVLPPLGNPAVASKVYDAIVKYINENAEGTYAPGTVVGVAPTGGGPLSAGAATGGVIA